MGDVPDHALVADLPARIQGWRCKCGEAPKEGGCPSCGVDADEAG